MSAAARDDYAGVQMPELSVVAPAFNQAGTIEATLGEILGRLDARDLDFELIVVSDGSSDGTFDAARRLASADPRVRVLDYDRNLGKGFAVRTGSLAARGRWVAWIDSDLDLDPSRVADFLARARSDDLDVVVGSKRHPESDVAYPRRRRVYSWLYQMLVRVLFSLDVRDTQVGMKLFRRDVLDEVLPVVLVKRYAFDLEVLAVSRRFGFERIVESPITLEYRFTGSGVGWRAIANALWDTAAVYYRLRLRRYYDRQRLFCDLLSRDDAPENAPSMSVISAPSVLDEAGVRRMEALARALPTNASVIVVTESVDGRRPVAPGLTVVEVDERREGDRLLQGVRMADTDLVGFIGGDARPSGGWAAAVLHVLSDPGVAVVGGPTVPRLGHDLRENAAGILSESRLGVGRARVRSSVGAMREIDESPLANLVTRRDLLERALAEGDELDDDLCGAIRRRSGLRAIFSPNAVVTSSPRRLFGPYMRRIHGIGIERGAHFSPRMLRTRHLAPVGLLAVAGLGIPAAALGGRWIAVWAAIMTIYALSLLGLGVLTFVLHRRPGLTALVMAGAAASHLAFALGLLRGLARRRRTASSKLRPASR